MTEKWLPDFIHCELVDGHENTPQYMKYGQGGRGVRKKAEHKAKLLFRTKEDQMLFARWWMIEVNYGKLPFMVNIWHFGHRSSIEVYMSGVPINIARSTIHISEVSVTFDVLTDMSQIIDDAVTEMMCAVLDPLEQCVNNLTGVQYDGM